MTFRTFLSRARRTRPRRLSDPTRPRPVRCEDGVPIAHVGPPGFPGEPVPVEPVPVEADEVTP